MIKIDAGLKAALAGFTANYYGNREKSLLGYDFEFLRGQLAEIRDAALLKNAELLDRFQGRAEGHGAKVLRAEDGEQANQMVLEIMREHGADKLVKSKSMVSEETRLNHFLAENGIEARETDLGEWIVQLHGQRPTHMVLPAIHLTRKDVARIFSQKLGRAVPEEPEALVRIAREELRKEIFGVKVGLTGANALIAENGSMMMVTNEGNGRLVSTVPPVHIVLASIEKVVPGMSEALALLRLLPKAATGQLITSYISFISGPHREAQYIIILDNHRSELLADPVFKEVLRCVKCSSCLNYCPVYLLLGGAQYSHIYMGGIGTLLTSWIHGLKESRDLAGLCLGCHRCEDVCPCKIKIADLVIKLRERLNHELGRPLLKRLVFDGIMSGPQLHTVFKFARSSGPLLRNKDAFARKLPKPFQKYDKFRSLPAPATEPLSKLFAAKFEGAKSEKGRVKIFAGCLVENFYPEIGLAAARVLTGLGYGVELIQEGCCGFPAANAGFSGAAQKAFSKVLEAAEGEEKIITLCPTCAAMLGRKGHELVNSERSLRLSQRVMPFSRFLVERESARLQKLITKKQPEARITYHESCHHKREPGACEASRVLLKNAAGKILEMKSADLCCGFAGTFSLDHPELSEALLNEIIDAIKSSGADMVAVDCPGCLLQIRGGCREQNEKVQVSHLAEILARSFNF